MNFVLRLLLAILLGVIATGLLDWAMLLTHNLNVLIGIVVAIVTFFSWNGIVPTRRV